jgi:hypothetical protein
MKNKIYLTGLLFLSAVLLFSSCKDDEDSDPVDDMATMGLSISGLEDLGSDAAYEGWLIVNGAAVSSGVFTVDGSGDLSKTSFEVSKSDLESASTFVLTIEPVPDNDPTPSKVHILAGDFNGAMASLAIDHGAALNSSFSSAAGKYILATPTDTSSNNEESGIWFLDNSSGSPAVGLTLPTLPDGWAYEGWTVISGEPVSTGTFTMVDAADDAAPYSGSMSGPPFPGEDFLNNAPGSLTFPTDIRGGKAVISIEPVPDNSPNPFLLKPLIGDIPANAAVHTVQSMGQNLSFPTGNATR